MQFPAADSDDEEYTALDQNHTELEGDSSSQQDFGYDMGSVIGENGTAHGDASDLHNDQEQANIQEGML